MPGIPFVISSPSTASPLSATSTTTSGLFDQSALSTLAERLVEAAKRAGADAADAVAVRGVSQGVEVRDGRVEESERSEGDDVGLRVLVGQRQAVVSTNDVSGDGIARLAERAVAMARVAPDDKYVGLADPALLARDFPDLDLLDPNIPSTAELERRACEAEAAALAVRGVTKSGGASASTGIGGMVLVTSTGFHGSYLRSSQGISMTAISGDGTKMERDYDFSSAPHASDLASPESVGRTQDQFPERPPRPAIVLEQHSHHRRSLAGARPAFANLRCRRRQGEKARHYRPGRADLVAARLRDRARARPYHHRPRAARRVVIAVAGIVQSASRGRRGDAGRVDRRYQARLLRHRPDRLRRQRRDRRLQPRRLRLLDRERRDHLSGQRGNHRGPFA